MRYQEILNSSKDVQDAWLAALIDGEGMVALIVKNNLTPYVEIANTYEELLDAINDVIGPDFAGYYARSYMEGRASAIRFEAGRAIHLLKRTIRYLIIKRSSAGLCIGYRNYRKRQGNSSLTEIDIIFAEKSRELNQRRTRRILSRKGIDRFSKYIRSQTRFQKQIPLDDIDIEMEKVVSYTENELVDKWKISYSATYSNLLFLVGRSKVKQDDSRKAHLYTRIE